jgi:hypothetical protein
MTDRMLRQVEDELDRLRRLREMTLAILRRTGSGPEEKLQAIEAAFEGERDEDKEAEEAGDTERLS